MFADKVEVETGKKVDGGWKRGGEGAERGARAVSEGRRRDDETEDERGENPNDPWYALDTVDR